MNTTYLKEGLTLLFFFQLLGLFPTLEAQTVTLEQNHDYFNEGGELLIKNENGDSHFIVQPDIDGNGTYVDFVGGTGSMIWNGQDPVSGSLRITGENSNMTFNTNNTGDFSLILPIDAVSSAEILNEVGLVNVEDDTHSFTTVHSNIASQTISVPADGYVLAIGTAQVNIVHDNGTNTTGEIGVSNVSANLSGVQDVAYGVPPSAQTGTYFQAATAMEFLKLQQAIIPFILLAR